MYRHIETSSVFMYRRRLLHHEGAHREGPLARLVSVPSSRLHGPGNSSKTLKPRPPIIDVTLAIRVVAGVHPSVIHKSREESNLVGQVLLEGIIVLRDSSEK